MHLLLSLSLLFFLLLHRFMCLPHLKCSGSCFSYLDSCVLLLVVPILEQLFLQSKLPQSLQHISKLSFKLICVCFIKMPHIFAFITNKQHIIKIFELFIYLFFFSEAQAVSSWEKQTTKTVSKQPHPLTFLLVLLSKGRLFLQISFCNFKMGTFN